MKIKNRKSKLWNLLKIIFPNAKMEEVWLTFNKTIWCPSGITQDLIVHEKVHIEQQINLFNSVIWWIRYIFSKRFRYSQELPAYKKQFEYLKQGKDRNEIARIKTIIAKNLSHPLYGNMVSFEEAMRELEK